MFLYAVMVPIISIIAIIWFILRYFKGKNSLSTVLLWSIFWIIVTVFSIFPAASNRFANLLGITRGLDFLIVLVFVILFYTILKLYFVIDQMQNNIDRIVKEVALENELSLDDEDE